MIRHLVPGFKNLFLHIPKHSTLAFHFLYSIGIDFDLSTRYAQVSSYCDTLSAGGNDSHVEDAHPGPAIAALMKLSFDEEHRLAMCQLGAIYVVARLVQVEAPYQAECCITLKRYAGMALTNLTFGDGNNKALLCSMKPFMSALVAQLGSTSEDLVQVK